MKIIKMLFSLLICVVFGCNFDMIQNNGKTVKMKLKEKDIIYALDKATMKPDFFPILGHGYFALSGNRINLYADDSRWAIVFEKTGYNIQSSQLEIELIYFGNCLFNLDYTNSLKNDTTNVKWKPILDALEIFHSEFCGVNFIVNPDARTIIIRGKELKVERDAQKYLERGIFPADNDNKLDTNINFISLVRYLDETNPELFRATEEQIRESIPADLPKIMVIDKWHHDEDSFFDDHGKKPSELELYHELAKVLVSKNPKDFKPKEKPNNDWRNWPYAGTM